MSKLIGIDTGGTYTDAVLFSEADGVLAKAKALTTRQDLSIGIAGALDGVIPGLTASYGDIGMVCLSTTLATNAIVEDLGDRVGLVLIGFQDTDMKRAGLGAALRDDPVLFVAGGHNAHGAEQAALDLGSIGAWLEGPAAAAGAFAVAGLFSIANSGHELAVRDLIVELTGKPATCGHELSARLNAPKRALTSLLNARLISIIHDLIDSTQQLLHARGVGAALMVVKGDGSLIAAAEARRKPIETILSGPAASIVGAGYLTGLKDAVVSDMGGTTTDIAILRDGRPRLDENGARVGGWTTMVEAVAVHTIGLGGDSEVWQDPDATRLHLRLGPRRVVPVSLLATQFGPAVHAALDRQAALPVPPMDAGLFAVLSGRRTTGRPADPVEAEITAEIAGGPAALPDLLISRGHRSALRRLVGRGAALIAGFTPSDAAHTLGRHCAWDRDAAVKTAALFARQRTRLGADLAEGAEAVSGAVIQAVIEASANFLLDAAFREDGDSAETPSAHPLVRAALARRRALVELDVRLSAPIIALGAPARTYYEDVAARLNTIAAIPADADVANAIGAIVGHVRIIATTLISRPSDEAFRAHLESGPKDFADIDAAVAYVEQSLRDEVSRRAATNGAPHVEIAMERDQATAPVAGKELFLEMRITATGTGRPAFA
ncbi:MAG: hydantoinase/oxoprolinase family protein, partial [Rhizobiales bacterium]|nr:hydantoinase/oxoprolinase family protein [Hyphomicrobiales bacterium]